MGGQVPGRQPIGRARHTKSVRTPPLIGLHGAPGAGRATVAAHLCDRHDFRAYAIADPLRRALYALDPLVGATVSLRAVVDDHGWAQALRHRIYGSEIARLVREMRSGGASDPLGDRVWLRLLDATIAADEAITGAGPLVITDVASEVEAQWVKDRGGVLWHIDRPTSTPATALPDAFAFTEIRNNDTVLALIRRVDRAVAALGRCDTASVA